MTLIGTAGHIDHGKSSLVRRLTGVDPDRLDEEQRRGMTIELGFVPLTLPRAGKVGLVDVPGHDRFIRTMLAGAVGIDLALLVVAADEGVMPQTREHLTILELLGINHCVVALTKADLVDGDWLDLVKEEVAELLAAGSLANSPVVPVSVVTGEGIERLCGELDAAILKLAPRTAEGSPYLPIDRVFSMGGFGTVVTGTLHRGDLRVGQEMDTVPGGKQTRVRGLQVHGIPAQTAEPGTRVAVNVMGLSVDDIERGDTLAATGSIQAVTRFDAWVQVVRDSPFPLKHGSRVTLHLGTADRAATVSVLGADSIEPGSSGWIQVRVRDALAAVQTQRFVLRMPSPARTIAGGEVVDVFPRHRRSDRAAISRLGRLRSDSPGEVVQALLADGRLRALTELPLRTGISNPQAVVGVLQRSGTVVVLGSYLLSSQGWEALRRAVQALLAEHHAAHPLLHGMAREEVRRKLRLPDGAWRVAVARLVHELRVVERGSLLALPGHVGGTDGRQDEVDEILRILRADPFSPPSGPDLVHRVDRALLAAMSREGSIVAVGGDLYFAREAYEEIRHRVVEEICARGQTTVAEVRDRLGTSRKYALAILEYLDGEHITRRSGDARTLGSRAAPCG